MPSIAAELKTLRQQVEKLQVEVAGRESLGSMVVWDEQNQSSVNQISDSFSGLVIHLTHEPSPLAGTESSQSIGLSQNEFDQLKEALRGSLASEAPEAFD